MPLDECKNKFCKIAIDSGLLKEHGKGVFAEGFHSGMELMYKLLTDKNKNLLATEHIPKNDIIILIMERKKRTQCHMCATRHINMCHACNDIEMRTYLNLLGIKAIDELDKKLESLKEKK